MHALGLVHPRSHLAKHALANFRGSVPSWPTESLRAENCLLSLPSRLLWGVRWTHLSLRRGRHACLYPYGRYGERHRQLADYSLIRLLQQRLHVARIPPGKLFWRLWIGYCVPTIPDRVRVEQGC